VRNYIADYGPHLCARRNIELCPDGARGRTTFDIKRAGVDTVIDPLDYVNGDFQIANGLVQLAFSGGGYERLDSAPV